MGVQNSKNLDFDNLSSEQKFMDRHRQTPDVFTNTDADSDLGKWSAARDRKSDDPAFNNAQDSQGAFQSLSRMMTVERLNSPFSPAGLMGDGGQLPAMPNRDQITKQKADMDAFREMMGEPVIRDTPKPADSFAPPSLSHKPVETAQRSALAAGMYGSILKPLNDEASKPVGLDIPSAWGSPKKKKVETPSWAPKPPPWLTQDPALNPGVPQRKF
jgi:hypothetical protein